jgi:Zn-dependent peptidase ImmA (M78 family)
VKKVWIDNHEIEKKALAVRQKNNIMSFGVRDIFSLIAQEGIDLIRYPFGKNKLLGFSALFEGKKVIVSNSSEILSREIFTIAHELGHVIYDLEDHTGVVKIDTEQTETAEEISEMRAFYFACCLLMPEEQIKKYIRLELEKRGQAISALDVVRLQLEFQVSYASMVVRLYEIEVISAKTKSVLFDKRNELSSRVLFKKLDVDERLLKAANVIEVPSKYLEYVINNYEKGLIPYSSLKKAFALIGLAPEIFKKEKQNNESIDVDVLFEEFE